eukprot:TRINITY_DN5075_c0_g1_i1.p1 TRINITY_DN5075_c0_g1~~TRINITY_DN5075_c0_g1_i1.p1  ORF type:complete len:829 (+),score=253.40 TRINITY_DN5075_c0_g1_i1:498-2984(+)
MIMKMQLSTHHTWRPVPTHSIPFYLPFFLSSPSASPTLPSQIKHTMLPVQLSFFESLLTFNEIILAHIQYIGMLNLIDVPWPSLWFEWSGWVTLFSLDLNVNIPDFPNLDFKLHWIAIVIIIPMFLTIITLFLFKNPRVVIWYFITLISLALTLAGVLSILVPEISTNFVVGSMTFVIIGGSGLLICGILYLVTKNSGKPVYTHEKKEAGAEYEEDDDEDVDDEIGDVTRYEIQRKSKFSIMRSFILASLFTMAGLLILEIVDPSFLFSVPGGVVASGTMAGLGTLVGRIALGLGALFFIYFVLSVTHKGNEILDKISGMLRGNFIKLILFVLTVIYIPVTNTMASAWSCVDLTCPSGFAHPISIPGNITDRTFTTNRNMCDECTFLDSCPTGLQQALCPLKTQNVLSADVTVDCAQIQRFYLPASFVMMLAFVLGVPYIYYSLIRKHTKFLRQIPAHLPSTIDQDDVEEEAWAQRLSLSSNSAKNLYTAFEKKYRYYKLLLLAQKLAIVICTVLLIQFSQMLATLTLVIHGIFLVWAGYTAPYLSNAQDMMSTASGAALTISSTLALLLSISVPVPDIVFSWVLVANAGLPILMALCGFIYQKQQKRKAEREIEEAAYERARRMSSEEQRDKARLVIEQEEAQKNVAKIIDKNLNRWTLNAITNFFLAMGLLAFVALALCTVGVLYTDALQSNESYEYSLSGATTIDEAKADMLRHQFVGYKSWTDFTDNCCCQKGSGASNQDEVELWRCRNKKTKSRARKLNGQSGLVFRDFCAHSFNTECTPGFATYTEGDQFAPYGIVSCGTNFTLPAGKGSFDAMRYERLWLW